MRHGEIQGAVYHNRIDRFVNTYIAKSAKEVQRADLDTLVFSEKGRRRGNTMIRNQLEHSSLGLHGTPGQPGFLGALNGEVDLIILDNYVDLIARQFISPTGEAVFLTSSDLADSGVFELEKQRLPIEEALLHWRCLIDWLAVKQPGARLVFINFPFGQHRSKEMVSRTFHFEAGFGHGRVSTIPVLPIRPDFILTPSHFQQAQYAMYAGYIDYILRGAPASNDKADTDL